MKEQFCSYEIALALKDLGFDEPCIGHYMNKLSWQIDCIEGSFYFKDKPSNSENEYCILAPLYQQVIDWLDDKGVIINLCLELFLVETWYFEITYNKEIYNYRELPYYNKRNEAREVAILKAIELIKFKQK